MVQVTYPGVYIQERASGVRTVSAVATSIAAFIDFFPEGPMNEAVRIQDMGEFNRQFGGVDTRSPASYGIAQFFLNGGSDAYVVRVAADTVADPLETATVGASDGSSQVITATAASAGIWGNNIRLLVEHNGDGSFNAYINRYESTDGDAAVVASDGAFLNLSPDQNESQYYEDVINEDSKLITITDEVEDDSSVPAANGTTGSWISAANFAAISWADVPASFSVHLRASVAANDQTFTASWTIDPASPPADARELRSALERAIRSSVDSNGDPAPATLAGATVELLSDATNGDRFVVRLRRGARGYDATLRIELEVQDTNTSADLFGFDASALLNVQEYMVGSTTALGAQLAGTAGADGARPGAAELIGARDLKTGLYALEDADLFNILCIPQSVELGSDTATTAVVSEALGYCEERRAFMIIDIPSSKDEVSEIQEWLDDNAGFRNKNAALYYPRVKVPDPENGYRLRAIASSGTMAGIFSRTDSTRGVWKAPAGVEAGLQGVSALDNKLTDGQNGILNPLGINCMREFDIYGPVCWGARTLEGADVMASEWKYIPIRRLALMIEESLFRGTKWVVFEPNDEPLWSKIRQNVRAFMMGLYRKGAFQGASPADAFYVKCDGTTTTANDRNLGIVNIEVGFAPLKPAEFVVITIQQIPDIE